MVLFLTITTLIFGGLTVLFSYLLDKRKIKDHEQQDLNLFMIHELRSPLSSIKAASSLLLSNANLEAAKREEILKLISTQSLQLLAYVSLLLDTSKLEAGIFNLQRNPNNIKDLIDEKVRLLQPLATERQIELSSVYREPIPSFLFDKEYIGHVVDNLLYNALKFTPDKGKITIVCSLENNYVKVSITDSGDGMDKEQIATLFKKFSQGGQKTANSSGLGLYFVKNIIDSHKGTIDVSSTVNQGSTFTFSLPFSTVN